MGLSYSYGEDGRELWDTWSAGDKEGGGPYEGSGKFNAEVQEATWASLDHDVKSPRADTQLTPISRANGSESGHYRKSPSLLSFGERTGKNPRNIGVGEGTSRDPKLYPETFEFRCQADRQSPEAAAGRFRDRRARREGKTSPAALR